MKLIKLLIGTPIGGYEVWLRPEKENDPKFECLVGIGIDKLLKKIKKHNCELVDLKEVFPKLIGDNCYCHYVDLQDVVSIEATRVEFEEPLLVLESDKPKRKVASKSKSKAKKTTVKKTTPKTKK